MSPLLKRWKMLAAIGHGVLFSLALIGLVRIVYLFKGATLPESVAGQLFLISSILAGSISAYLCARSLKDAELKRAAQAMSRIAPEQTD